jgi:hypothetical protein
VTAKTIGWALLGIGIFFLVRTAWLDRHLQKFRAPGTPAAAYLGKLDRWRRELYVAEGQPLVGPTRRAYALFCIASLLGALLLSNAPD